MNTNNRLVYLFLFLFVTFTISLIGLLSYFNNRNVNSFLRVWKKQSKRLDTIIDDISENESRNYSDSNRYMYAVYKKNNIFSELKQPSRNTLFKPLDFEKDAQGYNMMKQYPDDKLFVIQKNNTYTEIN